MKCAGTTRRPLDHGHSPFTGSNPVEDLQKTVANFNIERHCLIPFIPSVTAFNAWFLRIAAIPEDLIRLVLSDAIEAGLPKHLVEPGVSFLTIRRLHMMRLILQNLGLFKAIPPMEFNDAKADLNYFGSHLPSLFDEATRWADDL